MDQDRITGAAQRFGGKAEDMAGRVTGDEGMRARGAADQAAGAGRETLGQAKDMARDAADAISDAAGRAREWISDKVAPAIERGRNMDDAEVKDALLAAAHRGAALVRERPIAAIGVVAVLAYLVGRSQAPAPRSRYWR
jgi:uncharacterized protein YjbJ (UPF0337 family)